MHSSQSEVRDSTAGFSWYVLKVRSNCERRAAAHLRDRGFEEFSPSYRDSVQWSDRTKITERFLFPTYVFCRVNPAERAQVLRVPGVVNFVSFGAGPAAVPEEEVEQVRTLVCSGLLVTPHPFLEVGQKVRLERGPLTGVEGIVQQVKGSTRIVVSIGMLQRSVSTEVERSWVQPIKIETPYGGFSPDRRNGQYDMISSRLTL